MNKRPFYLTKRKLASGKIVYYFYTYDKFGNRTVPQSTGCSKKTDAFNYCSSLFKKGNLTNQNVKFKVYAANFFDEEERWYKNKMVEGGITENTVTTYQINLRKYIMPYFGEMYIDKITTSDIKAYRIHLTESGLSNKSINNSVNIIRIIFNYAMEDDIIYKSPVNKTVASLKVEHKREAFTDEELDYIFSNYFEDERYYLFLLLGPLTGMRFSEALGLTRENIKDGYIEITHQYNNNKIKDIKTKEKRFITIPKKLEEMLRKQVGDRTFIFSQKLLDIPIVESTTRRNLYNYYNFEMLRRKKENQLTYHSFRYYLNTLLLSKNIPKYKVDFVIGHSEGKGSMTQLYTTWKPNMYDDVLKVQEELLDRLLSLRKR